MTSEKRSTFGGKLAAVLVTAGGSVGLGNIWRFPYVTGENGGGAFLLVYCACLLLLGIPVMLAEFSIGRNARSNAVEAYRRVSGRWSWVGYLALAASFLILGFYFVVSGWTTAYFVRSVTGELAALDSAEAYRTAFESFKASPWQPLLCALFFLWITHAIIVKGVEKGIERSAKVMMPLLFAVLIALTVRGLLMPGAAEGLKFLFMPDFSNLTPRSFLVAMGQAFFSLSLGFGAMITYSSYFKPDTDLVGTAVEVSVIDTLVAVLASMLIFPTVFTAGIAPESGPSLVFITLPAIFNTMPWPMVWSACFFLLLGLAALTSTISLHEPITLYLHEQKRMSRLTAARVTTAGLAVLVTLTSLSLGVLNGWKMAGMNLFDLLDFSTTNILLPVSALATSIFAGWVLDRKVLQRQLANGCSQRTGILNVTVFLLRWICPVLLLCIFFDNFGLL